MIICRSFRPLIIACALLLLSCHTTRHSVSESTMRQDTQTSHREQASTQRMDSLLSTLSASADSITIVLYDNAPAPAQADSLVPALPEAKPTSPKARITIHSPRINKEERQGSNSFSHTNVADSTRSNTQSHTSTDDSKEVIGGAEPPNLTWVFIVLGLGITLLIIGAVFGYLWLHKKHII